MDKQSRKRYQQKLNSRRQQEILRGMKEAREGIATLRSLWPASFPSKPDLVRPLAAGIIAAIAGRTGWSRGYTRGVVHVWKMRCAYCKAVLNFGKRYDLNGEPTDQTVDDDARKQVRQRLAAIRARLEARLRYAAGKTGEHSEAVPVASSSQPHGDLADLERVPDAGNGNAGCRADPGLANWRGDRANAA